MLDWCGLFCGVSLMLNCEFGLKRSCPKFSALRDDQLTSKGRCISAFGLCRSLLYQNAP